MRKALVLCVSALLYMGAVFLPASLAAEDSVPGVTRTEITGDDNWGWQGGPESDSTIICPGGELVGPPPGCADSNTDRLHLRDGAGWSCMTSNDMRMTGVGVYTSNFNWDPDSNGPAWGKWKLVPVADCDKDAVFSDAYADLLEQATSYWLGTWHGRRQFDSDQNAWISELSADAKGFGGDIDGLQFKGTMWITTFTPFPMPYEYLFLPGSDEFMMPEAQFIGTIKE